MRIANNILMIVFKALALLIVLISLLFSAGCGRNALETDALLIPYMTSFTALAVQSGASPVTFVAVFAQLGQYEPGHRGQCLGGVVSLDATWWSAADEASREALFLHEAGHCGLGREHTEGYTTVYNPDAGAEVKLPISIMQAAFLGGYAFQLDRVRYIEELFQ